MKVTYYAASSIDGYIAKEAGDMSWLDDLNIPPKESGYEEFYSTIDALVMGRKTYEFIQNYGTWPYGDKPVWICTRKKIEPMNGANIQKETSPGDVVKTASKMGIIHLWLVGGGSLAASFINKSLLTDLSISQMPIILGKGISLFDPIVDQSQLNLKDCKKISTHFLQLEYEIKYT